MELQTASQLAFDPVAYVPPPGGRANGSAPAVEAIVDSDDPCFLADGEWWSGRRLSLDVARLAAGMKAFGVCPGDRVCLQLPNGAAAALAYYACFRIGAVAVPMQLDLTPADVTEVLQRVRPVLHLGSAGQSCRWRAVDDALLAADARFVVGAPAATGPRRPVARSWTALSDTVTDPIDVGPVDRDAPAVLLATSGPTGRLAFAAHSLATLTHMTGGFGELGFRRGQVLALVMPMMHVSGLVLFLTTMRLGIRSIFVDRADHTAVLDAIEAERCTAFVGTPTLIARMMAAQGAGGAVDAQAVAANVPEVNRVGAWALGAPVVKAPPRVRDVSSLQWCATSADVCPPGQRDAFRTLFGVSLHALRASTEASGSPTCGLQGDAVGRLVCGSEMRLVDEDGRDVPVGTAGEMLLRGPSVMLGYWNGPGDLERLHDGWHRTGDQMREDNFGHLWFVSRRADLVVRGGVPVASLEVEQGLRAHPAVRDVAIVGIADAVLGQRVLGFVVLKRPEDIGRLSDIVRAAASRHAAHELPERLFPIDEIPRNGLDEIDRPRVAARMAGVLATAGHFAFEAVASPVVAIEHLATGENDGHEGPQRHSLYVTIHKALRSMMGDTLFRVGRMDPDDADELASTLAQLDSLMVVCTQHIEHENVFVHPAIDARAPSGSHSTASDHVEHLAAIAALRSRAAGLIVAEPSDRAPLALVLYRNLAAFVAESMVHFHLEETVTSATLWAMYSDAELLEIHDRLVASIAPESMLLLMRWTTPALNPAERAALFCDIRQRTPPDAFALLCASVLPGLPASDRQKLSRALEPAATTALREVAS